MKLSTLVDRIERALRAGLCASCQARPVRGPGLLRCEQCAARAADWDPYPIKRKP